MTKFTCKDREIVYAIIKKNANLILAATDYSIVFADNVDVSELLNHYTNVTVEYNFQWRK